MADELQDLRCVVADSISFKSPPIEIIVGKGEERFYIHEDLLRSSSAFFDVALKKEWQEGQKRSIALPEEDGNVFQAYAHWLYRERIPCQKSTDKHGFHRLALCYGLEERILDRKFQDRMLDAMIAATRLPDSNGRRKYPGTGTIVAVYSSTPKGSPAWKLMVDLCMAHGTEKWIEEDRPDTASEFLLEFSRASLQHRDISRQDKKRKYAEIDEGVPCSYHHHDKDKPCKATRK